MELYHLLAAWRERWSKQQDGVPRLDYKLTRSGPLGWRLAQFMGHMPKAVSALAWIICLAALLPLPMVEFTPWGQVGFLLVLAIAVLPLRPYFGSVPAGMLLGVALLLSVRYLWWRASGTLVWSATPVLALSLLLWIAEFTLILTLALRTVLSAWPLIRASTPLSIGRRHWPSIELVALGKDFSDDAAQSMLHAMNQVDWPLSRIQLHFIDFQLRPAVRDLARQLGVDYRAIADLSAMSEREFTRRMLGIGVGELLMIVDGDGPLPTHLAQSVGPWFARDPQLALLYTPGSRIGAELTEDQKARVVAAQGIAPLSVVRRAAWAKVHNASPTERPVAGESLPLVMGSLGYSAACIAPNASDASTGEPDHWYWIAYGASRTALLMRDFGGNLLRRLSGLESAAWMIFLAWPLFALLTLVNPLRASAGYWLANAVPVVVAWYFLNARFRSARRFSLVQELRDLVLSVYLALATVVVSTQTALQGWWGKSEGQTEVDSGAVVNRVEALGRAVWAFANLMVLVIALHRMSIQLGSPTHFEVLFSAWAGFNLIAVWVWWAIRKDQAAYASHRSAQRRKTAMLRVSSGHTVACHLRNFPDRELELLLPRSVSLSKGDSVSVTIFHANNEYAISAEVTELSDGVAMAWVRNNSVPLYRSLAAAALAPGPQFARWLPGPDIARAIPKVLMRSLAQIFNLLLFIPRVLTRPLRNPISNPTGKRPT